MNETLDSNNNSDNNILQGNTSTIGGLLNNNYNNNDLKNIDDIITNNAEKIFSPQNPDMAQADSERMSLPIIKGKVSETIQLTLNILPKKMIANYLG